MTQVDRFRECGGQTLRCRLQLLQPATPHTAAISTAIIAEAVAVNALWTAEVVDGPPMIGISRTERTIGSTSPGVVGTGLMAPHSVAVVAPRPIVEAVGVVADSKPRATTRIKDKAAPLGAAAGVVVAGKVGLAIGSTGLRVTSIPSTIPTQASGARLRSASATRRLATTPMAAKRRLLSP